MARLVLLVALGAASMMAWNVDKVSAGPKHDTAGNKGKKLKKQPVMYEQPVMLKAAPPLQEVCQTVPVQVDSVCFENVPFKEAYICPQVVEKEVCEKVAQDVADTCYKPTTAMEAYDCDKKDKKKEECRMVPKQCIKSVPENEEYPCEEEACETVVKRAPQTCFRRRTSRESYLCTKHRPQRVCHEVPQAYESTCFQEETQQQMIPCVGTEPKGSIRLEDNCGGLGKEAEATCERTVMVDEPYECSKKEMQKSCQMVAQDVADFCDELVEEQKPYKCKKKQITQKCKMEHVTVPAQCERKKGDKTETYNCEKKVKQEVCKDVEQNVDSVCYQMVASKLQVPCTKQKMQEQCQDHEVEVPSTCFRQVSKVEAYPCVETVAAPPCPQIAMCPHFTTVKKAVPCTETRMKQECNVEEVPYEDTCTRQLTEEQPYDCSREVRARECKMVSKTCKRRVTRDVPFECSEKVCEKPSGPQVCYRKVKGKEAYPCTRTEFRDECALRQQVLNKTCYSQGVKPQQYPCKEIRYETICK